MADSRPGVHMRQLQPLSHRIAGHAAAGEFLGINTIAGFRAADGLVESYTAGTAYNQLVYVTSEVDATDGEKLARHELEANGALRLNTDVPADESWIGQTAHAVDATTASLDSDSVGDGTGTAYAEIGPVVAVHKGDVFVKFSVH